MILQAGSKNTPITIQTKVETQSASGAITYQWQNIPVAPQMWAEKVDRSGVQSFQSSQDLNKVYTRFRIDYREDLAAQMRIACKGRFYNIEAILDLTGNDEFLELMCSTGVNDG
jgi:SPP1 family predicted phage head-tail adaptor